MLVIILPCLHAMLFWHCLRLRSTLTPRFRFHLEVAQEPIHGRRKTEKDRRPLAHCPIVRLRIKECRRITDASLEWHGGRDREEGWEETELDMAYVAPNEGLLCLPTGCGVAEADTFPSAR